MNMLEEKLKDIMGREPKKFYSRMSLLNKISIAALGFQLARILFTTIPKDKFFVNVVIIICWFAVFALSNYLTFTALRNIVEEAKKSQR